MMSTVDVPIAAILSLVASREEHFDRSKPYQWLFVLTLSHIVDFSVKETNLEPWQQWELIGAYYHAVRINAFMVLGYAHIPSKKIFSGLQCHLSDIGDDVHVELKPAMIFECNCQLSPQLNLRKIAEKRNLPFGTENILDYRRTSLYRICVNGTCGEAVDIFLVLFCCRYPFEETEGKRAGKGKIVPFLILDQRIREARCLTQTCLDSLVHGMVARVPTSFPTDGVVVPLIFSALAKTGTNFKWTDRNVAIYSRALKNYSMYFEITLSLTMTVKKTKYMNSAVCLMIAQLSNG